MKLREMEEQWGMRELAVHYHGDYGWFVFPADPYLKAPYQKAEGREAFRWKPYGDKLPELETVATWDHWNYPGVRLAARAGAVSGFIVLDVDSEEAHRYINAQGHGPCPTVQSPREGGGFHLYFKHPGFYVKSTVAVGGVEGLDIRGDGGIVVLPPSLDHKVGRPYEWIIPPEDVTLPEPPEWLLKLLKERSSMKEPLDVAKTMAGIPEGQRDTELNRLAGKFRQMNIQEDVAGAMIDVAAGNCSPPFNRAEARAKVKWAYTHYEPGEDPARLKASLAASVKSDKQSGEETFTADELLDEEFEPVKWIVPELLPEGSMLFCGKPKMGKSWMAMGFCMAVATGGKALGKFDCDTGDVLYLALEDNKRRLQSRMKELLQSECLGSDQGLSRLSMRTRAKRLDDGLLEDIEEWLESHPEARLVVIDTLGSVRGKSSDRRTLYEQDYEVGAALTRLAGEYRVAIVVVHHLRKGDAEDVLDMVSGSTGLTGGMDGAMILNRTRSAADGILKAVHRDLEDDPEMALGKVEASSGWWKYAGDAEEYRLGKERRDVLGILANADGPMKPKDIADELDKPAKNVSELLRKMLDTGYVDSAGYGMYKISDKTDIPPRFHTQGSDGSDGSDGTSSFTRGSSSTTSIGSIGSGGMEEKKTLDELVQEMEEESEWFD